MRYSKYHVIPQRCTKRRKRKKRKKDAGTQANYDVNRVDNTCQVCTN